MRSFDKVVVEYLIVITNSVDVKKKNVLSDYLRASRKGSREAEITIFGHALNHHKVHKSEKIYDRKQYKAGSKGLPFDLTITV